MFPFPSVAQSVGPAGYTVTDWLSLGPVNQLTNELIITARNEVAARFLHLSGQTRPEQTPPLPVHAGIHPPAQCTLGYGQQAGGTHPTGMHTCSVQVMLSIP